MTVVRLKPLPDGEWSCQVADAPSEFDAGAPVTTVTTTVAHDWIFEAERDPEASYLEMPGGWFQLWIPGYTLRSPGSAFGIEAHYCENCGAEMSAEGYMVTLPIALDYGDVGDEVELCWRCVAIVKLKAHAAGIAPRVDG